MNLINKKNIYLLLLLVICLLGLTITPSYAKFVSGFTTEEDIVGVNFNFNIGISHIEEYEDVNVDANSYEVFNVEITNTTGDLAYYGIWYKMVKPSKITTNITIAKLEGTTSTTSGSLANSTTQTVTIIIINNSSENIKVNIGINSSATSTSDIEYLGGKYLITGNSVKPPNKPNLDNGNLIPVYYDETSDSWKKADSNNSNNSWYDYSNQNWANAILINDTSTRVTYQSASIGTEIPETAITAFFVWIPRYKYHVWNITRQAGTENTYSYNAFSNGIDIDWEKNTETTGNVTCTYNLTAVESTTNLSDICTYKETDTITINSNNKNYTDAWYTHPAFTFDNEEKTGFWIGKFETTGTSSTPTILPDISSLRSQTISEQFTTSQIFQSYGLSTTIAAHLLTNLEYGALTYLSYSSYGLCTTTECQDIYINNSSGYYTGRSGGAISGSDDLKLSIFYSGNTTDETMYNTTGYYNYKGYMFNYSGNLTTTKDLSKIASNTNNVTGVYDLVGGAFETAMGNMADTAAEFFPGSSGTSWNGSSNLANKYYQYYSYGTEKNSQASFNRARLGDATAENIGLTTEDYKAWKPPTAVIGADSWFPDQDNPWFLRSNNFIGTYNSIFNFNQSSGSAASWIGYRITLS